MGTVFFKTLIMFALAFIIAMFVALLIYWIRGLLTSVRVNSFFDDKSKMLVRRARRIHKIHDKSLAAISEQVENEAHFELFDFYSGINEDFKQPEDFHSPIRTVIRRKKSTKRHKNL